MDSNWTRLLFASFCVWAFAIAPAALAQDAAPATPATIVLPDGTECYFAGQGATLAYEGKRLNYTCGDSLGLIGDIAIANGTSLTLETATIDGTTITGSTVQTLSIASVELTDGTICNSSAQAPRRSIQDKPLDYFCDNTDRFVGLTGAITDTDGVLSIERITQTGFDVGLTDTVVIGTVSTAQP